MVTEITKEPTAPTAILDDSRPGSERHGGSAARRQRSEIRNINEVLAEHLTLGPRSADFVARHMGSWHFIRVPGNVVVAMANRQ